MIGKLIIAAAAAALAHAQDFGGEVTLTAAVLPPKKCPGKPKPNRLTSVVTKNDKVIFNLPINDSCQKIRRSELWCTTDGSQYDQLDVIRGIRRFHEVDVSRFTASPFTYRRADGCKNINCIAIQCNRQGCTDWDGHSASFGADFCFGKEVAPRPAPVVMVDNSALQAALDRANANLTDALAALAKAQAEIARWQCVIVAQPKISGTFASVDADGRLVLSWPAQYGALDYEVLEYSHLPSQTDPSCWLDNKAAWTLFKVAHPTSDKQQSISLKLPAADVQDRQAGAFLDKVYFRIRTHNKCDGHSQYSNPVWYSRRQGDGAWQRTTHNDETWEEVKDSKCADDILI